MLSQQIFGTIVWNILHFSVQLSSLYIFPSNHIAILSEWDLLAVQKALNEIMLTALPFGFSEGGRPWLPLCPPAIFPCTQ